MPKEDATKKVEKNYEYLLRLYSLVDEFLAKTSDKQDNLPEAIVAFCIVTEKLFKIRLHKENPILVYETIKVKDGDALAAVVKGIELNIETIQIRETLIRHTLIFQNEFSDDEVQVMTDIYNIRNHLIHGYKADNEIIADKENIVKKMGTVWEKISIQAQQLFSKSAIKANKPKKKYSEEELEKILTEEVKTKIKSSGGYGSLPIRIGSMFDSSDLTQDFVKYSNRNISIFGFGGERCPRCDSLGFSLDEKNSDIFSSSISIYSYNKNLSDLYECKNCGLELTKKEFEIAKKIKGDNLSV